MVVDAVGVEAEGDGRGAEIGAERIPWCRAAQPVGAEGICFVDNAFTVPVPAKLSSAAFMGECRAADAVNVRVAVGEDRRRGKDSE